MGFYYNNSFKGVQILCCMAENCTRRDFLKKSATTILALTLFPVPFSGEKLASLQRELKRGKYMNYPDEWFGKIVEKHVRAMFDKGYAEKISDEDLFHGHLIIKNPPGFNRNKDCYKSMNDVLRQTYSILYHTAEYNKRWGVKEAHLPIHKRTPRSILGFMDGTISPASDISFKLIGSRNNSSKYGLSAYYEHGTLFTEDIIHTYRKFQKLELTDCNQPVSFNGRKYMLDSQFYIEPLPKGKGPYSAGGQSFLVTFTCWKERES